MAKKIYKTVALILIFVGALFFFAMRMETAVSDTGTERELGKETFPYVQIETQGEIVGTLYGYSAPMEANIVRECMIPLAKDKTMLVLLGDAPLYLTSIYYEIVDKESGEVYETGDSIPLSDKQSQVEIKFDYNFTTSTEYIIDLVGSASDGRKIHYYSRLKYYLDNSHLAEKLAFAEKFHKDTFDKSKIEVLSSYLEPSDKNRNTSLASVDITSSAELVTWGNLSPKVVSKELVTVKEYNMETACIQYNYFVQAKTDSGKETYHIKEFYRVRYAGGHNYLLNYERTMEAEFDKKLASTQSSQLKLGITNNYEGKMLSNEDENILYFERGDNLYRYDMKKNEIMSIYSVYSKDASDIYRAYNEHQIRLLKVDEENNVYFCVYGYFSRGAYEGDVAVVLYEYTADGQLIELVYMPSSTTYQQLKEDFQDYSYVSNRGIYYFSVANTVYAYNIYGKRMEKLAENTKSNSFMTMTKANCYVWSSNLKTGYGENIVIYNLAKDERESVNQPDEETYVRLLGVIDENIVYGYVRKSDVGVGVNGSKVVPCHELYIANTKGEEVKKFSWEGEYVQGIHANGNVINITLCKKNASGKYEKTRDDSISNQTQNSSEKFRYASRVTSKSLTEWYIQFPVNFEMAKVPEEVSGPASLKSTDRFVRLEQPSIAKYYVLAVGQITGSYESGAQAIREADKQMGVVLSSDHQVVWERSGSFLQNTVGGLEIQRQEEGVSNLAACAYMLLKLNHISVDARELSAKNLSVYDMLAGYLNRPMNLKGCTLEQVLYFVSNNKPVIAMLNDSEAVVIEGYTTTQLILIDPKTGKEKTVKRADYEKKFKTAGNRFYGFMVTR